MAESVKISEENDSVKKILKFCILFLACYVISILSTACDYFIMYGLRSDNVSYIDKVTIYTLIEFIIKCFLSLLSLYIVFKKTFHIRPNYIFNIAEALLIVILLFFALSDFHNIISYIIPGHFPYGSYIDVHQKGSNAIIYMLFGGQTIKSIIQIFSFSVLFYMFFFKEQYYIKKKI